MNRNTRREIVATLLKQGRKDLARQFAGAGMEAIEQNWTEILRQQNTIPGSVQNMRKLGPERFHFIMADILDGLANVLALADMGAEASALRKARDAVKKGG